MHDTMCIDWLSSFLPSLVRQDNCVYTFFHSILFSFYVSVHSHKAYFSRIGMLMRKRQKIMCQESTPTPTYPQTHTRTNSRSCTVIGSRVHKGKNSHRSYPIESNIHICIIYGFDTKISHAYRGPVRAGGGRFMAAGAAIVVASNAVFMVCW